MRDSRGRRVEYLRLSLTERCNLACLYCHGEFRHGEFPRDEIRHNESRAGAELSIAEIGKLIRCVRALGITKVRLTGGEPLLRRDLEEITARVAAEIRDVAMTTNAQGLARRAAALKKAGLGRVNISLDSLKPGRYRDITRGGRLEETLDGIQAALAWGLTPVKLNCVIQRGRNDDEVGAFIALAREQPLHLRFIELMPFGEPAAAELRVCSAEILASHGELRELEPDRSSEPGLGGDNAVLYTGPGFRGTVGFISPLSRPFCPTCGRIRISADGALRPCLGNNAELDLRPLLAGPDAALRSAIEAGILGKPEGHHFGAGFVSQRSMDRIGG
ncbi:MAG: GTP 3',8-cyclase MoaA [Treponema sp.]|jgi:cyclic pyranopterin phosphate synthase|nr:GTP 3',8-cyclase MoaA [Treponema sp.]